MKKRMMILLLSALVMASCKKNYTCYCGDSNKTAVFETKDTKKNAEDACKAYQSNSLINTVPGYSCEIR